MRTVLSVLAIALAIGLIPPLLGVTPPPAVHDEFAYLLQADTFVRGRLTNPPPARPEFFETLHVLVRPTYAAKFPPAHALTMTGAMRLGLDPMVGVIVTVAFACATVAWMLRAALPARWAMLGGLLAATHPLVLSWEQSRWGGGVAMLGGALVGGATLRLLRRPAWWHGAIFGTGAAILANSRPFEGVLLCAACLAWVWIEGVRSDRFAASPLWRAVIPAAGVLLPVIGAMMFLNTRVTGDPFRLPYAEHARQYMTAPLFWWQRSTGETPLYGNDVVARFHTEVEYAEYASQQTPLGFASGVGRKLREIARDWLFPPTLLLPIAAVAWRARWGRPEAVAVALCIGVVLLHMALTPWFRPHYLAPLAGLFFLVVAQGLRQWLASGRAGVMVIAVVIAGQLAAAGWQVAGLVVRPPIAGVPREMAIAELSSHPAPGGHLVFVRYALGPQTILEWVYNTAEIAEQPIVWARDLGETKNAELRREFSRRSAWLLEVRGLEYRLTPAD